MLLLDAGFPGPAVAAASGFPLSPLTLLVAGRTDFFMLSSLMLVHRQLALNTEEGEEKGEARQKARRQLQVSREEEFFPPTEERKKESIIITPNTRKHLYLSVIKVYLTSLFWKQSSQQQSALKVMASALVYSQPGQTWTTQERVSNSRSVSPLEGSAVCDIESATTITQISTCVGGGGVCCVFV